jgi:[ribosomal protein S18]-alanine N-acetyltransferase
LVTWNPGGKGMWIRRLAVEDATWLAPLAESVFAPLDEGYGAAVQAWATEPTVEGWAAEVDGRAVGFALASRLGIPAVGHAHVTELTAIGVAPDVRRRGVARALLAAVVRAARSEPGLVEIRLLVSERNASARALFLQAGFTEVGHDGTYPRGDVAIRMRRGR